MLRECAASSRKRRIGNQPRGGCSRTRSQAIASLARFHLDAAHSRSMTGGIREGEEERPALWIMRTRLRKNASAGECDSPPKLRSSEGGFAHDDKSRMVDSLCLIGFCSKWASQMSSPQAAAPQSTADALRMVSQAIV